MTRRKASQRVENLQIPLTGEVSSAVLKIFIAFRHDDLRISDDALAALSEKYETLVYEAITEYVAPPTPINEVAQQISAIGAAARNLLCALVASRFEATESLYNASELIPTLPDNSWTLAGGLFRGDPDKYESPTVEEMERIVAKFADRARDPSVAGGVFFELPVKGGKTPTLAQIEYATLWLAVLAKLAIPSGRTESAKRKTIHEIAKNAAVDFTTVTGTRANRSRKRGSFDDFLERLWIACRLDQIDVKSSAYVQEAVDSQSENKVA